MGRVLALDPTLCVGCSLCVLTCSAVNQGEFSLTAAHVTVTRDDFAGLFTIAFKSTCRRCHQCAQVCPAGAIRSLPGYPQAGAGEGALPHEG